MTTPSPAAAVAALRSSTGADWLAQLLAEHDVTVARCRVRSVHHTGSTAASVLWECDVHDDGGRSRSVLYVTHASTRPVPGPTIRGDMNGVEVHVWRFPDDPYLPGLGEAVSRRRASERLAAQGVVAQPDAVRVRTRSYRPGRRAVVAVGPVDADAVLYLKILGGRSADSRARRVGALAAAHRHLHGHAPVPPVVEAHPTAGRLALRGLPGRSLRAVLRRGGDLPEPTALAGLVRTVHALPEFPEQADPDAYADITRHVALLSTLLPEMSEVLQAIGAEVALTGGPRGMLHGDLHDGQILCVGDRVSGLLDLDGVGPGHVAHDLARLLVAVRLSARTAAARRFADRLAEEVRDDCPDVELDRAAAGAWIGLATGPFRIQASDWRERTAARVRRAATQLGV